MRVLYSVLLSLAMPFFMLGFWRRSATHPGYRQRWSERLGRPAVMPVEKKKLIWVHAVSVGESLAAKALIERWLQVDDSVQFLVTTMTPSASDLVQAWDFPVLHQYMPFDLTTMHHAMLSNYRPVLIVLMETEIWPNLIALAHRDNIPVALSNARLSERSARRYHRLRALVKPTFGQLSRVMAQTEQDAIRLRAVGAVPERTLVTGSIKYDIDLSDHERLLQETLRTELPDRPIIVAGSLHPGEEDVVLNAMQSLLMVYPRLIMVIAPRHQERFEPMAEKLTQMNISFARRSAGALPASGDSVWLLDSVGELRMFYGLGQIALIGGSWIDRGGHNPMEAAMQKVPVITGPSTFNFNKATAQLREAGALRETSARDLTKVMLEWLRDPAVREQAGIAGRAVVAANQGATQRQLELLQAMIRG